MTNPQENTPVQPVTLPDVAKPTDINDVLQQAWRALQVQIPGLPDAEIRAAEGQRGSGCVTDWAGRPLVLVSRKTLAADPEETLGFLLHEAAHGLVRGGVTSAAHGRWHTRAYRLAAERLGLRVTGYANSVTALHGGQLRYAEEVRLLKPVAARQQTLLGTQRTRQTQVAATCACVPPKHIRAMPSTLTRRTVMCTECGQPFTFTSESEDLPREPAGPQRTGRTGGPLATDDGITGAKGCAVKAASPRGRRQGRPECGRRDRPRAC